MGNERIDRRAFLKLLGIGGTGLAITTLVGCGGGNKEIQPQNTTTNPTGIEKTEQPTPEEASPRKEGLAGQLGILPFEVLYFEPGETNYFATYYNLKEGFRGLIIKLAIENLTENPLALDNNLAEKTNPILEDAKVLSAQGFSYDTSGSTLSHQIGIKRFIPIIMPPGSRFNHFRNNITEIFDMSKEDTTAVDPLGNPFDWKMYEELNSCLSYMAVQVPITATGLKLQIPGYEPIDIDKSASEVASKPAFNKRKSDFNDAIGGKALSEDGNIQVTIKDFRKLDNPQSVIPARPASTSDYDKYQFYQVELDYTNLNQGDAYEGRITIYSVDEEGNVYIVYQADQDGPGSNGHIGFDEIGPGFSKTLTLNLVYPKSAKDVKFVLQGKDPAVFNAPLVVS